MAKRIIVPIALAAFTLTGCCLSGSGCYVPVAGVPIAWDGLGTRPSETTLDPTSAQEAADGIQPRKGRRKPKATEVVLGPLGDDRSPRNVVPYSEQWWASQESAERDTDARLKRKMEICRGCLSTAPSDASEETTSSIRR